MVVLGGIIWWFGWYNMVVDVVVTMFCDECKWQWVAMSEVAAGGGECRWVAVSVGGWR